MNQRVLIVDGPMRGYDVPYSGGGFVVFPSRGPLGAAYEFVECRYQVDRVRSAHGELFLVGFLEDDVTWRVRPDRVWEAAK